MIYVFDIDGTICSDTNGNYKEAIPFFDRIKYINTLFEQGNHITMFTARGMSSENNNQIKAINKYYTFTENQLKSWNVKYNELILGKPQGDFYIDDKGVKDEHFFAHKICF